MNNSRKYVDIADVDVAKISLVGPKKHEFGMMAYVGYIDGGPLRLRLPALRVPWPAGESRFDTKNPKKVELNLSFDGMESDPALQTAHRKCQEIDNRIADLVYENRDALFPKEAGRTVNKEDVRRRYQSMLSRGSDANGTTYPDRLKLRIDRDKTNPKLLVGLANKPLLKDANNNVVSVDADSIGSVLAKGTQVQVIMDAKFLFVVPARQSATSVAWVLRQGKITSVKEADDWDIDDFSPSAPQDAPRAAPPRPASDLLDDDDLDSEDEELQAAGL
jgi:hypothetical protein